MIKAIVNPPSPDRRYLKSMAWQGVNVVGGVKPTGKFPKAVGSGIFGLEGQDEGVFDGPQVPNSGTGIFYNDSAQDSWETQQPDLEWVMLRRPGRPLYPGSSARGIVLIGPSMGTDDAPESNLASSVVRGGAIGSLLLGAAVIGGAWYLISKLNKEAGSF